MSQFAQVLQSFRSGTSTRAELFEALDKELSHRHTAPRTLMEILDDQHSAAALPTDLRQAVADRIASWSEDDTLLLAGGQHGAGPRTILRDGKATGPVPARARVDAGAVLQGRFKLVERIGEGGMSRVYKAIDLRRVEAHSPNPFLAVKVLTIAFDRDFDSLKTLDREADKLRSLTHPNIVRVIDVDRDGDTVFMTMEYLPGESLHEKLKPSKGAGLTQALRTRIVTSIAEALEFAHRTGIVHGDLKPGNVIIADSGDVKVIDFGIARFLARPKDVAAAAAGKDWEALNALTPRYASPEMLEDQAPDPRDDVYALACIAHEVLTGRHPFGRISSVAARESGAKLAPDAALSDVQFKAIARGLRFDRHHRTSSVQAFVDEFSGKRPRRLSGMLAMAAAAATIPIIAGAVYLARDRQGAQPLAHAPQLTAGTVFRDCPTCPLMRVIPAGTLLQGSMADPSEGPAHRVRIAAPIAFAPEEVTIGEFQEFADDTALETQGCNVHDGEWHWRSDVNWETLDDARTSMHPVSCVSWDDAIAYAAWLSKRTAQTYRLPSASEWEYAASAGASPAVPLASKLDAACKTANVADQAAAQKYPGWSVLECNDRYVQSAPVGSFAPNAFGLHDMIGNVFEWAQDCWSPSYAGAPTDGSARVDGDCNLRELRGGSWFTSPAYLRASYRNRFAHDYRSSSVGFRVVREIRQ